MLVSKFFGQINGHALSHINNQEAIDFIDSCVEKTGRTVVDGGTNENFFIQGFALPAEGAFGLMNDCIKTEANFHANRPFPGGVRQGQTPITLKEPIPATHVVIIGVLGKGLFTAYGHFEETPAMYEPWDPNCPTDMREKAEAYWAKYSISYKSLRQCAMITRHRPSYDQFKAAAENGVYLDFLGDQDAESMTIGLFESLTAKYELVNAFHIKFGFLAKSLNKGILVFYNGTRDEGFKLKATEILD